MQASRGSTARRSASPSRRTTFAALALLGALSIGTGALTGVSSASTETPTPAAPPPSTSAGEQQASTDLALDCPFADPAGPQKITLSVSASLPATVQVGTGLKFRSLTASFTLSHTVAAQLAPDAGASLRGGLSLDLTARQGEKTATVPAPFTIAETPVPATGDVKLTATADVPDQAITVPGQVSFDVGAPAIALKPATDGTAGVAPVKCTLAPGQTPTLASILATPAPSAPGTPGQDKPNLPQPPAAQRNDVAAQDDDDITIVTPLTLVQMVATSSVYRLGTTVTSSPTGLLNGFWTLRINANDGLQHDPSVITGSVGFKPVTATFLGFGFVPASATVEFLPADYQHSKLIPLNAQLSAPPGDTILTTHAEVVARMSNAKINGVPLDLGPDCVTATPISLNLFGPYDALVGGTIGTDPNAADPDYRGFVLPPFVHCGVAEQLSPLLTGMASTTTNVNQAKVVAVNFGECTKPNHTKCPPLPTPTPTAAKAAQPNAKPATPPPGEPSSPAAPVSSASQPASSPPSASSSVSAPPR